MNPTHGSDKTKRAAMSTPAGNGQDRNALQLSSRTEIVSEPRLRYADGWRAGKPEEDPEKLKRWGFISARPSEFLIRMRGGNVLTAAQGASCFKLPWDSVAVIPTTVQRLQFTADQVTSEKVGVMVTGLAVYRIAEPLIAFRMLNYSFPERASEKLEQMLVEMFVGAARRLVANLSVEQCLTKRKEGLAVELMKEIAPVVSGTGRAEDRAHKGWGVVIDTIEIQDVRVLSQQVFANMQARFRQEQERLAREAELAKERALEQQQAEANRQIELAKLAAAAEIAETQRVTDEQMRLRAVATEARVSEAKLAQDRALREAELANQRKLALDRLQAELEVKTQKQEAEDRALIEVQQAEARRQEAKAAHERAMAAARLQAEAELRQAEQQAEQAAQMEALVAQARRERAKAEYDRAQAQAHLAAEVEKAHLEAQAERARLEAQLGQVQQQTAVVQAQAELARTRQTLAEAELAIVELEMRRQRAKQELDVELKRALREIENDVSANAIQLQVAQRLPQLAQAFQQQMGEVHVTSVDGANPFGYIAAAVEGVMGLARSAGLTLPHVQPAEGNE